jgi:hypothetical protein
MTKRLKDGLQPKKSLRLIKLRPIFFDCRCTEATGLSERLRYYAIALGGHPGVLIDLSLVLRGVSHPPSSPFPGGPPLSPISVPSEVIDPLRERDLTERLVSASYSVHGAIIRLT